MEENNELREQQRSSVTKQGIKSSLWGVLGTAGAMGGWMGFTALATTSFPIAVAVGVIGGAVALLGGYKALTTDVDQAIGFEEINAQRTASFTAKALVQEMKKEGISNTAPLPAQQMTRADGKSWVDYVKQQQAVEQHPPQPH